MDRLLKVAGEGTLRFRPDTICAELTLDGTNPSYAEAICDAQKASEEVKNALVSAGFDAEASKTSDFRVETEYEGYRDKDGNWKQKFAGYRYVHTLKIKFAADNVRLGAFIAALTPCEARPLFSFGYTVKDAAEAKRRLLSEAVKDCGEKAETLARAAGVKLGKLVQMEHAQTAEEIAARPVQPMRLMKAEAASAAQSFEISPEDIEVSEKVIMVWEIE